MTEYALPGNQTFMDELVRITERSLHMRPVVEATLDVFKLIENEKFQQEGPGWAPLAEATVAFKQANDFPDSTLMRTGALWKSMIGVSDFTEVFGNYGWAYTSTIDHAWEHQEGTSRMPARPIVDLKPDVILLFVAMMEAYLVTGAVKRVGPGDVSGVNL